MLRALYGVRVIRPVPVVPEPVSDAGPERGGCQPAVTHARRAVTRIEWFSFRAAAVARPTGVVPSTGNPPSVQREWPSHVASWTDRSSKRVFQPGRGWSAGPRAGAPTPSGLNPKYGGSVTGG